MIVNYEDKKKLMMMTNTMKKTLFKFIDTMVWFSSGDGSARIICGVWDVEDIADSYENYNRRNSKIPFHRMEGMDHILFSDKSNENVIFYQKKSYVDLNEDTFDDVTIIL